MSIIHIETTPVGNNHFELLQTWVSGVENLDERTFTEKHEDRMYAAMTNLGYACRWLNDAHAIRGAVCIVSDKDGKDVRFNGEHDDLFEAVYDRNEYKKNRLKYGLLYGKHLGFLDRIRELADVNEITFTQNNEAAVDINFHG